jgi:DNA excision repair protein ERCC-3
MTWHYSTLTHLPLNLLEVNCLNQSLFHTTPSLYHYCTIYHIIMSDPGSPASSLDFFQSDESGSEAEYAPATHRRAANKRRPNNAAAGPSTATAGPKKALKIKINVGAASSSRAGAALHPMEGDVEMDEEIEDQVAGVMGSRVMDLSNRELKKDHSARPLWVDEAGHMYVVSLAIEKPY